MAIFAYFYKSSDFMRSTNNSKKSSSWFWRLLSKSADLSKPWGRFFQILCVFQKIQTVNTSEYRFLITYFSINLMKTDIVQCCSVKASLVSLHQIHQTGLWNTSTLIKRVFPNFSCMFLNPNNFSNLNSNCSNLLYLRNFQGCTS